MAALTFLHKRARLLAASLLLVMGLAAGALQVVAAESFREYDLKAVFLFNFAQFVEWPSEAFPQATTPFVIGILGDDPFGGVLDTTVANETLNGRPFVIRRFRRAEDIDTCHILFVSRSEADRLERIMPALAGRTILTVGDSEDFARAGGMIALVTANNRIRLQVNMEAAMSGMLVFSSKLLRPAEIVTTRG